MTPGCSGLFSGLSSTKTTSTPISATSSKDSRPHRPLSSAARRVLARYLDLMADNKTKVTEASVGNYLSSIKDQDLSAKFPGRAKLLPKLGKHKAKGGCVHIRRLSDIDPQVLQELAAQCAAAKRRQHG